MRENEDQNNIKYEHFLHSYNYLKFPNNIQKAFVKSIRTRGIDMKIFTSKMFTLYV